MRRSIKQPLKDELYFRLLGQKDEPGYFCKLLFFQLQAILHDAFTRVYKKYKDDRRYSHSWKYSFDCVKKNPFMQHFTGFIISLCHNLFS